MRLEEEMGNNRRNIHVVTINIIRKEMMLEAERIRCEKSVQ